MLTVLVIVPNVFGALMSRAGGPKLAVFVRLNASARNSKYRLPPALNCLARTASTFLYPGARATPMGQLPHVPSGATANALMSSQCVMFWSDGTGSPTQLGRSLPRTPCSERARPSVTVIGKPVWAWKIPLNLQPPMMASARLDDWLAHLRPLPNGSS